MTGTSKKAGHKDLERLREFIRSCENSFPTDLLSALRGILAAMEYGDQELMRSHGHAGLLALQGVLEKKVGQAIAIVAPFRVRTENLLAELTAMPDEPLFDLDDLGRAARDGVGDMLERLTSVQALAALLAHRGYSLENADLLAAEIVAFQEFKAKVIDPWPWSDAPLPPVDEELRAAARAEYAAGKGEPIEDLIQRLAAETHP